jgi:nucleoside-diphosphate-sugar epimerase
MHNASSSKECVLLTGATGFLGGATLAEGLDASFANRWLCIVRAEGPTQARSRLQTNLARFMGAARAQTALSKIDIVVGDIAETTTFRDPRLSAATIILHLAAETSYRSRAKSQRVNVTGTRHMAELARTLPHLRRFVHVGTAMICGSSASQIVREEDYPSRFASHFVDYTKAKADAEVLLRDAYADIPIVVARPSIVVGHTTLGARPSASIFWMFRAGDRLRLVADDPCGGIDVVPVDWAARVLLFLASRTRLSHRVYHLSAGIQKRTLWRDLAAAFDRVEPGNAPRVYATFDPSDFSKLRWQFERLFGLDSPVKVAMLRAMREYYRFSSVGAKFCNERLAQEGVEAPPSLPDYLDACISEADPRTILEQFADDLGMFDAANLHAAE